jgi:hypothetical protein
LTGNITHLNCLKTLALNQTDLSTIPVPDKILYKNQLPNDANVCVGTVCPLEVGAGSALHPKGQISFTQNLT